MMKGALKNTKNKMKPVAASKRGCLKRSSICGMLSAGSRLWIACIRSPTFSIKIVTALAAPKLNDDSAEKRMLGASNFKLVSLALLKRKLYSNPRMSDIPAIDK